MANQQQQQHIRNRDENGMNEYDRVTELWNQSNEIERRRRLRSNAINNTPGYQTGLRIHHIRTIQVPSTQIWIDLFRNEILNPALRAYAEASIDFVEDRTHTLRFAGQMEVSLIMQENYRPGVHVAIFIIQLTPHREFHDGHVIQREFSEGSFTHQTINRMFNTEDRAVVTQATEYSILEYLADDDEMLDLLHTCFLDPEFNTMRFSYVAPIDPQDEEDYGQYVVDPNARNSHRFHNFNADNNNHENDDDDDDDDDDENDNDDNVFDVHHVENENHRDADTNVVAIPPPPQQLMNDFAAVYQYYYDMYQEDPMFNIINYNDHNNFAPNYDNIKTSSSEIDYDNNNDYNHYAGTYYYNFVNHNYK